MKVILPLVALELAIALAACTAPDGTPMIYDGSVTGTLKEITQPGSTFRAKLDANDRECQQSFKPGTEDYRRCRSKLDNQIQ